MTRGPSRLQPRVTWAIVFGWAVLCFVARARCGEPDILTMPRSQVVAILRVRDIHALNKRIEAFLLDINPHTRIQNPVRAALGRLLRNPRLDKLGEDAYLEVVVFDPQVIKGSPVVAAFPVTEALDYRRLLADQPGVTEEGTVDDITRFRESNREEAASLHFSVTAHHIAVFGLNNDAVRMARDLYERSGARGFLARRSEDVVLQLHLRRLVATYEKDIHVSLRQLREDVVHDVIGDEAPADHPLGRSLDQAFTGVRNLLKQTSRLALAATITPSHVLLTGEFTPAKASFLGNVVRQAKPRPLKLAAALPTDCVAFQDNALWPQLWMPILEEGGSIVAAGLNSVIGQEVRQSLRDLVSQIERAGPLEIASGVVPPPTGQSALGPVRIQLIRWARPEALDALATRFMALFEEDSPLQELLLQNRIECRVTSAPQTLPNVKGRTARLQIGIELTGAEQPARPIGFYGEPREYWIGQQGDTLVVVTSRNMQEAGQEPQAQALRQRILTQMMQNLGGATDRALSRAHLYTQSLKRAADAPLIVLAAVAPLPYVQLAIETDFDWHRSPASTLSARVNKRYAEEFGAFASHWDPATLVMRAQGETLSLRQWIPKTSLQELARACLGISISGESKK